jgi:hypothetical protein
VSFFDEADEPPRTEIRTPNRPASRRRRSGSGSGISGSGGRRRPPAGPAHQSILARRAIAVVALVIVVVLIAVGVNSCQSSARKSALQNYGDNVNHIIGESDATSTKLFGALSGATSSNESSVSQTINQAEQSAQSTLSSAQHLSVPSSAKTANATLVQALRYRLDGITNIAGEIQPALGTSVDQQAVSQIAAETARFYASDVMYKDYVAPELVSALHANGIAVGGADGVPVNSGQFLPSIDWLRPHYVGGELGVSLSSSKSSSGGKVTGLHGDNINFVSVGGSQLSTDGNSIAATPPPTFSLNFTDGGNFPETDVGCKVTVTGTSISGAAVVPSINKGQTKSCQVTLKSSPPAGNYNVVADIGKVPGETNLSNNKLSYPVTFK